MSDREWASPADTRDLAAFAVLTAVVTLAIGMAGLLVVALVLATALAGGPLAWPSGWLLTAAGIVADLAHPAAAAGPPWSDTLDGSTWLYWTVAGVIAAAVAAGLLPLGVHGWRRFGPTPPGHASRADIRAELSPAAARATAAWTRPSLSVTDRRRAPLPELAAPLHRGPAGPMWSPLENPTGALAPTQSGKSRRGLVHLALDAPGALLCSTTKPDLLEFAGLARTRREMAGPVLVFDATGQVRWPARLRWSPITGCTDWATAYRRAHTMVEASAVGLANVGGNDKVFRERATFVLGAYLLAAATGGAPLDTLVRWALQRSSSGEVVDLLVRAGYPQLGGNLLEEVGMVAETADAVWLSVRRVIEPFLDPVLRDACSPRAGAAFDARAHIANQGSLFLIAGQHQAAHAVPLLTALAEDWLTTAQEMALGYPTRRLDPPATAVLDELPNATPLPQLPDIVSDSAGRGVLTHWAAQSMAQLEDTFTPARARQLLDNTTTITLFGGLKDKRALDWASALAGHHDRARHQAHSDGLFLPGRTSIGTETVPTYRPGAIRTVRRGQVLVLHRALRPIQATTVDVTDRPDWAQLRRDVDDVRNGTTPVTEDGYLAQPAGGGPADRAVPVRPPGR